MDDDAVLQLLPMPTGFAMSFELNELCSGRSLAGC